MKNRIINDVSQTIKYGIWVDGVFTWVTPNENDHTNEINTFISPNVNLEIEIKKEVQEDGTQIHCIHFLNLLERTRQIKCFFSQSFKENSLDEVTFYAPTVQAIIKAYNNQYLLMNGMLKQRGIVQYCTNFEECSSLQDGLMMIYPFTTGNSITVFSLEGQIEANEKITAYYWQCNSCEETEVVNKNGQLQLQIKNEMEDRHIICDS